jgi:aspartate-semialdehyde dehydrogenase
MLAGTRCCAKVCVMRVCILGATGLVGRETIDLVTRAWPDAQLALYASRDQELLHGKRRLVVEAASRLEAADAPRGELAFVALDDEHSKRFVPRLLELGYRVVDKSNTYRTDPKVVLGVAGVNHALLTESVRLVANPNCTTIPLTLALGPLQKQLGIEAATVSTYQAISGAGIAALDTFLADSLHGYEAGDRLGLVFDALRYAGNTVPHNGGTDESGFSSEERKLTFESRKILQQAELAISAQCCRVPVAVGHYENVWLTLRTAAPVAQLEELLVQAPYVRLHRGSSGDNLSALSAVHDRDRALVGRLRVDPRDASGRSVCLTVIGDNLRLGAATNAVRLATAWFPGQDADLNVPR